MMTLRKGLIADCNKNYYNIYFLTTLKTFGAIDNDLHDRNLSVFKFKNGRVYDDT